MISAMWDLDGVYPAMRWAATNPTPWPDPRVLADGIAIDAPGLRYRVAVVSGRDPEWSAAVLAWLHLHGVGVGLAEVPPGTWVIVDDAARTITLDVFRPVDDRWPRRTQLEARALPLPPYRDPDDDDGAGE